MMDDEGNIDTVEYALINLVKSYSELYDPLDPNHYDKTKKEHAWAEIAKQLNTDETFCYSKWRSLVDYYKKRKKAYDNGTANPIRRWVYYEAMSFIDIQMKADGSHIGSENSISSIRSVSEPIFEDGSNNQNYFDETQYQSLDGVEERATTAVASRVEGLQDPLSDDGPPFKRAKKSTDQGQGSLSGPSRCHQIQPRSEVPQQQPVRADTAEPISTIYRGRGAALSKSSTQKSQEESISRAGAFSSSSATGNDCPHYHFCMSLAARFRNMDPASATYTQMKIMELILKSEYPDEYNRRRSSEHP